VFPQQRHGEHDGGWPKGVDCGTYTIVLVTLRHDFHVWFERKNPCYPCAKDCPGPGKNDALRLDRDTPRWEMPRIVSAFTTGNFSAAKV
jgi:hypothetical protein